MLRGRSFRRSASVLVLVLAIVMGLNVMVHSPVRADTVGWQWFKVDTHVHSVFSADANPDLGILSYFAQAAGYNALFLTDHNNASSFSIERMTANHVFLDDSLLCSVLGNCRWKTGTFGSLTSSTNAMVSSPVNTGTKSLNLASSSSGYGETFVWTNRGPNFRSGSIILKVSIYPTRIDPGSGVYVSASIGGDPSITFSENPLGYTTQAGVISPFKSTILVWQLGSPRVPSSDPSRRVLVYSLGSYKLNTWNTYNVNVTAALQDIPPADRPLDYDALTFLKIAAAASSGTVNAYFDTYHVDASAPVLPADEFVYRNSIVHTYDTANFKIFPSIEIGQIQHANRFNFDISDPAQFTFYYYGINGILPTQQTGYPAQLNHPGSPGGVTDQQAISTQGEGADFMETRQDAWLPDWDAILQQNVQIIGTGSTDKHHASYGASSDSTYIFAQALDFNSLMRSLFEGRAFTSKGLAGPVVFNLDSGSQVPYPARYPVYVSPTLGSASVHLSIPSGLRTGSTVKWIRNGTLFTSDTVSAPSYDQAKVIPLGGSFVYVRAEVRTSTGAQLALTEPIFFVTVPNLPTDKSFHIDNVATSDGHSYTKIMTKGITTSVWDTSAQALSLTFDNPINSLTTSIMATSVSPQSIAVGGSLIPAAASASEFQSAVTSTWFYDADGKLLFMKVLQSSSSTSVAVQF